MAVWILEDNFDRMAVMRDSLRRQFDIRSPAFFQTAPWFIENIEPELDQAHLISLDHDLEDVFDREGDAQEAGTGRDVADFLASKSPVCPIIIHSTNVPAAIGMQTVLDDAGWHTTRITPYDDTLWIDEVWIDVVTELIGDPPERVKAWPFATLELADEAKSTIARRVREIEEGTVELIPGDEVFRNIDEKFQR